MTDRKHTNRRRRLNSRLSMSGVRAGLLIVSRGMVDYKSLRSMATLGAHLQRPEAQKNLASKQRLRRSGRGGTRIPGLTDVNPVDGDHNRNVILLVVESFNN